MTEEKKPTQESQQPQEQTPEHSHPLHNGLPWWREKETSKWPLWLAGVLVVGGIAWAIFAKNPPPASTQTVDNTTAVHALTTSPGNLQPADPETLCTNCVYAVSADTPLCDKPGADAAKESIKTLRAGAEIGILSAQTVDNVKWYRVEAADPNGTPLMKAWVSAPMLKGQTLTLLRDVLRPDGPVGK